MTKKQAYANAKAESKKNKNVLFVVPSEKGFEVATEQEMDTFFLGTQALDAFVCGELDQVN